VEPALIETARRPRSLLGDSASVIEQGDVDAHISVFANRLTPETINRISTARRKLTSLIRR
jgi:hypothetical protein